MSPRALAALLALTVCLFVAVWGGGYYVFIHRKAIAADEAVAAEQRNQQLAAEAKMRQQSAARGEKRAASQKFLDEAKQALKTNDHQHALLNCDKAIQADPTNADAYIVRAKAYELRSLGMKFDDMRDAGKDYTEALRLKPDDEEILWSRWLLYSKAMGRAELDHRTSDILSNKDPGGYRPFAGRDVYGPVRAEFFDLAFADLNLLLQKKPDMDYLLAHRARMWADQKLPEKGLIDAEKAVTINPRSGAALCARAICRLGTGDKKGAEADFREAIRADHNTKSDAENCMPEVFASRKVKQ